MATPLNDNQISEHLSQLAGWERDGDKITKTFKAETYMSGLALAAAIGTVCDSLNHHPDMEIGWKKVVVSFTTHDAGSKITAKDMEAATKVESLGYSKG